MEDQVTEQGIVMNLDVVGVVAVVLLVDEGTVEALQVNEDTEVDLHLAEVGHLLDAIVIVVGLILLLQEQRAPLLLPGIVEVLPPTRREVLPL